MLIPCLEEMLDSDYLPMSISFSIMTSDSSIDHLLEDRCFTKIFVNQHLDNLRKKRVASWYNELSILYHEYINYSIEADVMIEWLDLRMMPSIYNDVNSAYDLALSCISNDKHNTR